MNADPMTLDPITLSVIQAGLQQVCDEMDLSFSRAAFSPVIAEANDRSDGIYAADDGALIAQGAGGLPVALCSSLAAGLLPLLGSTDGAAPVVDPTVWDAMYDHTMVGLVACMLTGLVVTTVAGAFVSPQVIEVDATAKAKTKALDWFR